MNRSASRQSWNYVRKSAVTLYRCKIFRHTRWFKNTRTLTQIEIFLSSPRGKNKGLRHYFVNFLCPDWRGIRNKYKANETVSDSHIVITKCENNSQTKRNTGNTLDSPHVTKLKFHQLKYLTRGNRVSLVHKQEYWIINTDDDALAVSKMQSFCILITSYISLCNDNLGKTHFIKSRVRAICIAWEKT